MMHNTGIKSEADTGALTVGGSQPVWMTLNEARDRAFTGEVVFEVDPEVIAYLDNGVVYYAERTTDVPLGRRLVEAGVVDTDQLELGTVRVGDVEHLGRLFDRDPSVDRDAVLVVTESFTQDLISELANHAVTTVRVTAYRHHPSGVHRWFVAPLDASARPLGSAGQIDTTVVDELPGGLDRDEIIIEWDDFDEVVSSSLADDEFALFDPFRADETLDRDERGAPESDDTGTVSGDVDSSADHTSSDHTSADHTAGEAPGTDEYFQVTWPDGTEEAVSLEKTYGELVAGDDGSDSAPESAAFVETEDGDLRFDMPRLDLDEPDEAIDEVPEDVAEAVRRAIAAIESASMESASVTGLDLDDLIDIEPVEMASRAPDLEMVVEEPMISEAVTTELSVVESAPAAFSGFAPPSLETSAEVMYAQISEAADVPEVADVADLPEAAAAPAPTLPNQGGVASVVFVDDDEQPGGGSNERSSALRRLIGSLRRKDH